MLMTQTLYYEDSYAREASVTVLAIENIGGRHAVVTDRTVCYPEGGGQSGDRGVLGDSRIVDTRKDDGGRILHVLEDRLSFACGDKVMMRLDWDHRYDYMQQHTAQHLVSGTLYRLLGVGTVSVHFGRNDMSVETDRDNLAEKALYTVEDEVNRIVRLAVPVSTMIVSRAEARNLGLRRPVKVDGDVRIVRIGEYDMIACGGVHVSDTSQLRYIQYIKTEKIRGHVRTFWTAGDRAVASIRKSRRLLDEAGTLLSAPTEEVLSGIALLQRQLSETGFRLRSSLTQLASLRLASAMDKAPRAGNVPVVVLDLSGEPDDALKSMGEAVAGIETAAVCLVQDRDDGTIAWMFALKGPFDATAVYTGIKQTVLPLIEAKGGGKPPLWQGVGRKPEAGRQFLQAAGEAMMEMIDVRS